MTRTLSAVRSDLDAVDRDIVVLLARRQELAVEAARIKHAAGVATRLPHRETEARAKRLAVGQARGLDAAFLDDVFAVIVAASVARQEQLRAALAASDVLDNDSSKR
jgi:chorismate mutase